MMRGADYNLARMSGMLDLSRDEKARVGRLRPRRRAVNRAAVRPDGYHVGKLAFRRKVAGNVLVIHDSLFHQHLSERQGPNFRTASSLNVCSAVETSPRAAELQRNTWYLQAVLNKVWETRNSLLDDAQVERAVVELYEERALIYHDLLIAQNEASQELLVAIARNGIVSEPTSAEFLVSNHLGGASTVRAALKDLVGKDMVYKTDSGWIVYDRLFAEYLRRNA